MTDHPRVALYLSVSTDDGGQTVENQRGPLREFCVAQGWDHVTEYADEASGTDLLGRKSWRRLLDDAVQRRFDLLLVWRLDRMVRSVLDAAQALERLRAWGVGLRSYSEPYLDTTSPFGEALFYITMAYAQLERGILSELTKAGMERARRQGQRIGRPAALLRPGLATQWPAVPARVEAGEMGVREAARDLGVSPSWVSRRVRRHRPRSDAVSPPSGRAR